MTEAAAKKPTYSRRFFWLAVFIVLLFGGYTAGWFYLADMLEKRAAALIAGLNRDGASAECANPTARGFPFRIGLYCDRVAFARPAQGFGLTASNFRSAGQIYDPMRVVAELDGPASLALPGAAPLAVNWEALRASVRLATPLPQRVSLEARTLAATSAAGSPVASVQALEAHMRPNGADLDLAATFEGLALDPGIVAGRTLPPLAGQADLGITGGVALVGSRVESLRGQSGTVRNLAFSTSADTGMTLSGPFAIGADGLLDATLRVTVRNPNGLSAVLAEAFPERSDQITMSLSGLAALGRNPSLPLRIVRGRATLGFIPLGQIPPL
jgi:hypothetical protein